MEHLTISSTGHGFNYLPEYYAASSGVFAQLGLTVTTRPCDPWTGVLEELASGVADISLGGLWVPAMYAGMARELVVVGQINARFPMFIVTREPVEEFDWNWMRGRTVLVPGFGGTAMYEFPAGVMREAGADLTATRFVRDLPSEMLVELFTAGLGDAIVADALTANKLHHSGVGFKSCALADAGGPMPNSVYYTRRENLDAVHDRLVLFLAGVRKGMTELTSGRGDPTSLIAVDWPDVPSEVTRTTFAELAANGTWSGTRTDPAACDRWVSILYDAGLVTRKVPLAEFVDMRAADAAELL